MVIEVRQHLSAQITDYIETFNGKTVWNVLIIGDMYCGKDTIINSIFDQKLINIQNKIYNEGCDNEPLDFSANKYFLSDEKLSVELNCIKLQNFENRCIHQENVAHEIHSYIKKGIDDYLKYF